MLAASNLSLFIKRPLQAIGVLCVRLRSRLLHWMFAWLLSP